MRKLTLRKAFSFIGMAALLSLVYVTAFGASFNCAGQLNCTGTSGADSMVDGGGTNRVMYGLAGDDEIKDTVNNSGPIEQAFGGAGDDNIHVGHSGTHDVFGGDGNDTLKLTQGNPQADGGWGDDLLHISGNLASVGGQQPEVRDGPGQDTILDTSASGGTTYRVFLGADNERDTLQLDGDSQNIILSKNGGREVINCGGAGTLILNGNRKAVDTQGNNLLKAALRGGVAQSNCTTIVP